MKYIKKFEEMDALYDEELPEVDDVQFEEKPDLDVEETEEYLGDLDVEELDEFLDSVKVVLNKGNFDNSDFETATDMLRGFKEEHPEVKTTEPYKSMWDEVLKLWHSKKETL